MSLYLGIAGILGVCAVSLCGPIVHHFFRFVLTLMMLCMVPGFLYLKWGSPHLQDQPFAEHYRGSDLEKDVASLSHEIAGFPTDYEMWIRLGKGLSDLGYYREAMKALKHADALKKSNQSSPKNLAR